MINNVTLMGRLAAAPELKTTQRGVAVTSFPLAVDRNYTPKGEEKQTDFITCVAWRTTAEFISKHFNKGDMLAVTGEIQTRKYTDKNNNQRVAVEVVVSQASFCGGKNSGAPAQEAQPAPADVFANFDDSDLPF